MPSSPHESRTPRSSSAGRNTEVFTGVVRSCPDADGSTEIDMERSDHEELERRAVLEGKANWTEAEAAEWLGVPPRMMRRLIQERRIAYYKAGRYVRLRFQDVKAFRDANVHPALRPIRSRHTSGIPSWPKEGDNER